MPSLRYCMSNNFYTWMLCQLWRYKKVCTKTTILYYLYLYLLRNYSLSLESGLQCKVYFFQALFILHLDKSHQSVKAMVFLYLVLHVAIFYISNSSYSKILQSYPNTQKWIEWTPKIPATKNLTIFHITSELK